MVRFFMVFTFKSLTNEDSCQVCKDECLYECNQYFNDINEYNQRDKQGRCTVTKGFTHLTEDEDETEEGEGDDVSCCDVRE